MKHNRRNMKHKNVPSQRERWIVQRCVMQYYEVDAISLEEAVKEARLRPTPLRTVPIMEDARPGRSLRMPLLVWQIAEEIQKRRLPVKQTPPRKLS